jgi:outer membrane receptor protein involved in Fe transport
MRKRRGDREGGLQNRRGTTRPRRRRRPTGWLLGTYLQDEWKISNDLTLNAGLRFDQMVQHVDANQFSPRVSLTRKPYDGTTFHAGYARNFTPPQQVIAAPTHLALVQGTSQQPEVSTNSPVLPERSHVFDAGVVQTIYPIPGLEMGVDAYYKTARDLLDDGQFGAAYVLKGFNYERGENVGLELKSTYTNGNFRAYGNVAWARQIATNIVSNQLLFAQDELNYIASHSIYTDHAQVLTASADASYVWNGTRFSASMIHGSGLRSGFANTDHLPSYTQVNVGLSHDFNIVAPNKPTTLRFDVVNLFDRIYEIRDGSGIGVFAPQFGPRRGSETFDVGVEYASSLGQIGSIAPSSQQSHIVYGITDFKVGAFDVNLGVGYGLTTSSHGLAMKFGISHGF